MSQRAIQAIKLEIDVIRKGVQQMQGEIALKTELVRQLQKRVDYDVKQLQEMEDAVRLLAPRGRGAKAKKRRVHRSRR